MRRQRLAGPLALLVGCLLPVAGAIGVHTAAVGVVGVAAEVVLLGWLVVDALGFARRAALGVLAAVAILVTTWLYGGHHIGTAVAAGTRILYLVLPAAMLAPLIRPSELGDHLGQRLHLPARPVVGAVAALQRLDSVGETWRQVERARRARGLGLDGGPVRRIRASAGSAFALLVVSMRQTTTMAEAMDARGFAAATRRTWAEPAPWRWGDWLLVVVAVVLAVLPWLLDLG